MILARGIQSLPSRFAVGLLDNSNEIERTVDERSSRPFEPIKAAFTRAGVPAEQLG
jgi:hypothetical protein